MRAADLEVVFYQTDLLVMGGGTAGCMAAVTARELAPDLEVTVVEKANLRRSGCLAAGVNAINAYLNPGQTPASFLEFARREAHGLVREDLVLSLAERLNAVTARLEDWGVPFPKDEQGRYLARGSRSIWVHGEAIKPALAQAVRRSGARVLNHVVAGDYLLRDGRVVGLVAFDLLRPRLLVISARATVCTTGGASGIYPAASGPEARGRTWYPLFNAGSGYAMGLRAGAELTSLEMRFIALRVAPTMAPTGTVAQGAVALQVNALGEEYLAAYGARTTAERLQATLAEERAGRGPCYLVSDELAPTAGEHLTRAYLEMCPAMPLWWADQDRGPGDPLALTASEPYLVGGHAQAGYWVDVGRRTTLKGLYAAGDVAGGSPKKYVSGCLAEGELAARTVLGDLPLLPPVRVQESNWRQATARLLAPLEGPGLAPAELEAQIQGVMDTWAGGAGSGYALDETRLLQARRRLNTLAAGQPTASDLYTLMRAHETLDRLTVARALVEHLLYRKETRWPAYQERVDYPKRDDRRWLVFVNSVWEPGAKLPRIVERPLPAPGSETQA